MSRRGADDAGVAFVVVDGGVDRQHIANVRQKKIDAHWPCVSKKPITSRSLAVQLRSTQMGRKRVEKAGVSEMLPFYRNSHS